MKFKSHPYYDNSDACEWLSFLDANENNALQNALLADQQRLCQLALDRIRGAAGESFLAERPYFDVNELLYFPIGDQGYRVYVEYYFYKQPDENSPDSDFWWVMINCPYAIAPFPTGRREEFVIGMGWDVG